MPEGHTLHRLARRLGRDVTGRAVRASSPQGRFAGGAAEIDGDVPELVEAHGKHLLATFASGAILHVHLGLFGKMERRRDPAAAPRGAVRLRLATERVAWDLRGPTACRLIGAGEREHLLARLGPDPLRPGADPEAALERIGRSRRAIGDLLLDQSVIAGIGNVYRAEILHLVGLPPQRPGRDTSPAERREIWDLAVALMAEGARAGRIVTVPQPDAEGRRLHVYRRKECASCGGPVSREMLGARPAHWCPACQPAPVHAAA
jgi:formamidopyrimidine-DNA glycosylase